MAKASESNKGLWTILIVFGGLFGVFVVFAMLVFSAMGAGRGGDKQIGVIEIVGPIQSSKQVLEDIRSFAESKEIKGIIVRIDSPGGSVGASQEIFEALRKLDKKVVVSMGNVAASGGYYIACAAPKVFANAGTVTGSIGVISQTFEVDAVMEYLQLTVNTVTTGEYKDTGSPFRDFSEKDRKLYEALLQDIYLQFVDAVAEGRGLERKEVLPYADGRIFTGRQALEAKLVDELGGFEAALDYMKAELEISGEPTLVYPKRRQSLLNALFEESMSALGTEIRQAATPSFEYRWSGAAPQ
ncbi:MAG: signal peptide peptidase SppA [Myxococcota bacterium]|jgi:protease-4|nr:signal peptide peptidase SppA [Myxococcota bacterium]